MSHRARQLVAAIAATIVVLVAAGAATANEEEAIVPTSGGAIEATSLGSITFTGRGFIEIRINCALTLEGYVSAFENTPRVHIGEFDDGSAECDTGTGVFLFPEEGDWPILLASETDFMRSPTLAPLTLELAEIEFDVGGLDCLYQGDVAMSLPASGEPLDTELATISGSTIRKVTGSAFCPTSGTISGTLAITQQQVDPTRLALQHNVADVGGYDFGQAGGDREITFVNYYGEDRVVTRANMETSSVPIAITDHTCRGPRTLTDGFERAETSFCRVRIRYTRAAGDHVRRIRDRVLVYGDPGGNTIRGIVNVIGR